MPVCTLCPRRCSTDRSMRTGVCGMPDTLTVARIAPHMWEEPPISGTRGSGTVFFSGCNLRCVFCQNRVISHERRGTPYTEHELCKAILALAEQERVHNINLVTPTHYSHALRRVLEKIKPQLKLPIVWNSSAYESVETLRSLDGLVDIYLPDFKYASSDLADRYSAAPDYPAVAAESILEMYRQVGAAEFDDEGLMTRGVLVRHLVLPGHRADSVEVMRRIVALLPPKDIRVSVMRQYTPDFAADCPYKNLHRRVTEFEYRSVLDEVSRLGLLGYAQGKDAADRHFTPNF